MKKVLFVAKFNEYTKELQKNLSDSYETQLCSDNVAIVSRMLQMFQPDLVLINLDDFDETHRPLFEELTKRHGRFPTVTFGDADVYRVFESFYEVDNFHHVMKTADEEKIKQTIQNYIRTEPYDDNEEEQEQEERKLVLLVDDSPMILRSMKQMLEKEYRVMMATSGMQAMSAIAREKPDAVILDYEMPMCDGKETLEMIRKKNEMADIPVIFLTGHGDAEHIQSVLDLNPAAYFLKPPKAEKIRETLRQLLWKEGEN